MRERAEANAELPDAIVDMISTGIEGTVTRTKVSGAPRRRRKPRPPVPLADGHVLQIEGLGCFVASAAMAAGTTYEDARERIGEHFDPYQGVDSPDEALVEMGFEHNVDFMNISCGVLRCDFMFQMIWGRKAILFLPGGSGWGMPRQYEPTDVNSLDRNWPLQGYNDTFTGADGGYWNGIDMPEDAGSDETIQAWLDGLGPDDTSDERLDEMFGDDDLDWETDADVAAFEAELAAPADTAPQRPVLPHREPQPLRMSASQPMGHFVYWDGERILDPGTRRPYSSEGVEFEYMLLFNHMR